MFEKKTTPWGALLILLGAVLVISYYIGGLFKLSGVNLTNIQENLLYIFTHPLHNWWSGEKSMGCLTGGFLVWILFVGYYTYHYRDFHFGTEFGSEDWGDPVAISKRLQGSDPENLRILSKNLAVSREDGVLSNNNMILVASPGRYKTTGIVERNIITCSASVVMLDVKGASQRKLGNYLLEQDYKVNSFNLKEPWLSDRYNPFLYIERESDLIRLITNLQASVKKPEAFQGDPFWDDGVRLYLLSMFFLEWLTAKEEARYGSMNNILELVNLENKKMADGKTSRLEVKMNEIAQRKGDGYPPVRDYRKLKEGATETVRSIIIMVNSMLALCETADMKRIFSGNDINIPEIGLGVDRNPKKKTALFLILPDNDTSYNFIINMFYTQLFDVLMRIADNEIHGPLPVPVEVWADEFYAGPKPADPEQLMGTIRSRNISMIPILQSISQAQTLYKNDKWKILFDNSAVFAFYGAAPGANDTHKYISELLGKATIDTRTDGLHSGRNGSGQINHAKAGREMMTPAEVRRMHPKDCIIFVEGELPVYDQKNLLWEQDPKLQKHLDDLGPYEHPVHAIYNEERMEYRTVEDVENIRYLDQEDAAFYIEAAKTDDRIKIFDVNDKEFLYLNWHKPVLSDAEIMELFRNDFAGEEEPSQEQPEESGSRKVSETEHTTVSGSTKDHHRLKGSVVDCLKRYAGELSQEQINEILLGMESGLTEKQIKTYFFLPPEQAARYRRAYMAGNK